MTVYGKGGKRYCCFPPFPQTLEIAPTEQPKMNLLRSDFHIPSAPEPTVKLSSIQYPKGQNPLRHPSLPSGSSFDWKRLSATEMCLWVRGLRQWLRPSMRGDKHKYGNYASSK